jgi:hypothetical protein
MMADTYLQTLQTRERMHIRLTSIDLLAAISALGSSRECHNPVLGFPGDRAAGDRGQARPLCLGVAAGVLVPGNHLAVGGLGGWQAGAGAEGPPVAGGVLEVVEEPAARVLFLNDLQCSWPSTAHRTR